MPELREAAKQIIMTMYLAAMQADGVRPSDLSQKDIQRYVDDAATDFKLVSEAIETSETAKK